MGAGARGRSGRQRRGRRRPRRPGCAEPSGHRRRCRRPAFIGRAGYRPHRLTARAAPVALRRRPRLQRGRGHRRDGRARCASGLDAHGPPVGADRGRQREHRRHRRRWSRRSLDGDARPAAAQRREPRQGLLRAPRDARRRAASCGCTATPTARRSLPSLPALLAALDDGADVVVGSRLAEGARVGRRQPLRRRIVGRSSSPCAGWSCASRRSDLFCGFKLWRARRPTAVSAHHARRLDVRRRGAGAGARAGLPDPRGRHRVERPRGLAAVDAARARAGRARAGRRPPGHVRREVARRGPHATPAASAWRDAPRLSRRRGARSAGAGRAVAQLAPLAGLLLRVRTKGGTGHRRRRLPGRSTRCSTSTGCARRATTWLSANLYDLAPGPRSFLHPGVLVSGVLHRARARRRRRLPGCGSRSPSVALFAGALRASRRFLDRRDDRRLAARARAVLRARRCAALVGWRGLGASRHAVRLRLPVGRAVAPATTCGATCSPAIAVGLLPLGMLALRARPAGGVGGGRGGLAASRGCSRGRARRSCWSSCAAELRRAPRTRAAAPTARWSPRATAAPLALLLRALEARRRRGSSPARRTTSARWPWWVTRDRAGAARAAGALRAYATCRARLRRVALRSGRSRRWSCFCQPFGTFPRHALQGLTLPLVVLAVRSASARARAGAAARSSPRSCC